MFIISYDILFLLAVPVTLSLLPIGRGDAVFEKGDGLLEVCVEAVRGVITNEITVGFMSGYQTAEGKPSYISLS